MGRPANPQARTDLLEQASAYVLRHGLTDLSLRPLAGALNVSARLLLYHFGSKEQLVIEILSTIALQQQAALTHIEASAQPTQRFDQLWTRLTTSDLTPFLRSQFEVELRAIDGDGPYRHFAADAIRTWLAVVAAHLKDVPAPTTTFVLAALTGLLIDRFSTGDEERTDEAFRALRDALHAGGIL